MKKENRLHKPLLTPKTYREGCPGCRNERLKEEREGYPVKELCLVALLVLCNSLPISSLFPYIYFMVRDFHIAATEDIGYYAGILGSSFMFGRFLTSIFWGIAADKYGRKPVMIISIMAIIVFNTLFGLSLSFWMAASMRFLLGSFNGLLGPIKAYASEVCREEHQALGLSTVGTMWGIGLIIGPALGGYFAQPADKYPEVFSRSSLFGRFPYFLPCICITVFSVVILITTFWLPETLHNHPFTSDCQKNDESSIKKMGNSCQNIRGSANKNKENKRPLLKNWPAMSSIILYCVFSLADIAYSEIFSLWAVSSRSYGGLNFSTSDLGTILAITGFGMLVFQLLIFPKLANLLGPILTTRIPLAMIIPVLAMYPCIAMLTGLLLWIAISAASICKNILSMTANTGMFLLLNNSVPQHQRGIANGVALTGMSLFKTIGPSGGGALFAWAQKRQRASFLPGNQIVFFVLCVLAFLTTLMTFKPFLPESTNKAYSEDDSSDKSYSEDDNSKC